MARRQKPAEPVVCLCGDRECAGQPIYSRGLTLRCYRALAYAVRMKHTTWAQLVADGDAKEAIPHSERRRTPARRRVDRRKSLAAGAS